MVLQSMAHSVVLFVKSDCSVEIDKKLREPMK
jgi:hypothetical protein